MVKVLNSTPCDKYESVCVCTRKWESEWISESENKRERESEWQNEILINKHLLNKNRQRYQTMKPIRWILKIVYITLFKKRGFLFFLLFFRTWVIISLHNFLSFMALRNLFFMLFTPPFAIYLYKTSKFCYLLPLLTSIFTVGNCL